MKKLKNHKNYYRVFALGTVGSLMLLTLAFIGIPELDNNSFAFTCTDGKVTAVEDGDTAQVGDVCDTADVDVNVNIGEILDITAFTIDGVKYCDDTATCDKTFAEAEADLGSAVPGSTNINTKAVTVTVDTNVSSGYQLQLEGIKTVTTPDATTQPSNTDLVNSDMADSKTPATISTISGNMTKAQFEAESYTDGGWGYSLDSGANYSAIPATATRVIGYNWVTSAGTATIVKDTTFTFGARPSSTQAAGTYEGGVRFTVVAGSGISGGN